MPTTITVHGSNGEVEAEIQPGIFIRGKHVDIVVTAISPDEEIPEQIRRALVGCQVNTVFTSAQLNAHFHTPVPEGMRAAYVPTVITAMREAGKDAEATELKKMFPNEFDLYLFEPGTHTLI